MRWRYPARRRRIARQQLHGIGLQVPALGTAEEGIGRRTDSRGSAIQHVRVDHRGGDVLVAEEPLHGPDVVSGFQKMRRERLPERMAARWLANPGGTHGDMDGALDDRLVSRREDPLPRQLPTGIWV